MVFVDGAEIVATGGANETRIALADIPLTRNGTIGFQVENAMSSIAAAWALGIDWAVIRRGLATFVNDAATAPGRFNLFDYKGATLIADYGHNPDAIQALCNAVATMPAKRRSVVISGAGPVGLALACALHDRGLAVRVLEQAEEAHVAHPADDGREIALPYTGEGAAGVGKPLKSILHMNPDIPIYLATGNEATVKLTAEIADGWVPMGFVPGAMAEYRPWLEEGFRPVREAWLARAIGLGSEIRVTFREGDIDSGVFSALDESGALVLTRGGASRKITAGEIFFAA